MEPQPREYQKPMQPSMVHQYSLGSFLGQRTKGDTSAYFKLGVKEGSLPSTGTSTPLSEWSTKKDDGELSHDTSSGSVTPTEVETMLNVAGIAGVANHAPMNSNSLGRALLSLPSGFPLMPPPGLSLPSGEQSCVKSSVEAQPPPEVHASVGSAGHPYRCAKACRYVKRKGGCKNGAACTECHLCFWQRTPSIQDSCVAAYSGKIDVALVWDNAEDNCPSLGSVNHPEGCAMACKYVRRKGGCRLGKSCLDCHKCVWRRNPVNRVRAAPLKVGLVENSSPPQDEAQDGKLEGLIKFLLDSAAQELPARLV